MGKPVAIYLIAVADERAICRRQICNNEALVPAHHGEQHQRDMFSNGLSSALMPVQGSGGVLHFHAHVTPAHSLRLHRDRDADATVLSGLPANDVFSRVPA